MFISKSDSNFKWNVVFYHRGNAGNIDPAGNMDTHIFLIWEELHPRGYDWNNILRNLNRWDQVAGESRLTVN